MSEVSTPFRLPPAIAFLTRAPSKNPDSLRAPAYST